MRTAWLLILLMVEVTMAPCCPAQETAVNPQGNVADPAGTLVPAESPLDNEARRTETPQTEAHRTENGAELTAAERAWIRSNTVSVGLEDWPPIVFLDDQGAAGGLAGGYLRLLAEKTGLRFRFIAGPWDSLLQGLKAREIDLLPATYHTEERATFLQKGLDALTAEERQTELSRWISPTSGAPVASRTAPAYGLMQSSTLALLIPVILVLLLLPVLVAVLPRFVSEETIARAVNSPYFSVAILGATLVTFVLVGLLLWTTIERNREATLQRIGRGLSFVNQASNERITRWLLEQDGTPPAVFTKGLHPAGQLSDILRAGGSIGDSGETYLVDGAGRMVTQSRFADDLLDLGLFAGAGTAGFVLDLRDPGGNMVMGYRPQVPRADLPWTKAAQAVIARAQDSAPATDAEPAPMELDLSGYRDYRGIPVFGAWTWNPLTKLGVVTEIDRDPVRTYSMYQSLSEKDPYCELYKRLFRHMEDQATRLAGIGAMAPHTTDQRNQAAT